MPRSYSGSYRSSCVAGSVRGHGPGRFCMRCVWPCRSAPETLGEPRDAAYGVPGGPRRYACATASSPAFAASFRHPRHPSRVPPRLAHWDKTVHMPPNTMPSSPHPRNNSPSTAPPATHPRKSSPNRIPRGCWSAKLFAQHCPYSSTSAKKLAQRAIKHRFWAIFRSLGELFRAHAHIKLRRANFFAHSTRQRGDDVTTGTTAAADAGLRETAITTARPSTATVETDNTSATEKRTQNTHFTPAKAMAVSVWSGLVLWTGCFEGCWLLLVVLFPLARVLVG